MSGRFWLASATSVVAIAVVTGAVYALEPVAPVLSLGVLYLFAVLLVAALWGLVFASAVSVAGLLAFNWFFLAPRHTFHLADSENWVALAVYLVTAVSVSGLAARARRRAAEAEQQRREASFAAEVSALLLGQPATAPQLGAIAVRAADLLGVTHCWIELGDGRALEPGEQARELESGGRRLGWLYFDGEPDEALIGRVVAVLASLLATAIEREELSRSDVAKTTLLRSVSHDLRSPLTAIGAASEVLAGRGSLSPGEREELLASIRLEVQRLDRFVGNLLDLSRLEAGVVRPASEVWPVDALLGRALEAIGVASERVQVALPAQAAVRVDAAQVEHALANLLENALEHSPTDDSVELRADVQADEVVLRVVDRGPGIAVEDQAAIFEPFRQGATGGAGGSGLGLAIARGFAELNGGRLWVESEPGRGATFALALPLVAVPAAVS